MTLPESATRFLNTVKDRLTSLKNRYSKIDGEPGGLLYSKSESDVDVEFDTPIKMSPSIVRTEEDSNMTKGYAESFQFVFDNWMRISRGNGSYNTTGDSYALVANPDEIITWEYDDVSDRILSTINSVSLVGFLSPQALENYVAEVIIRSAGNDDDFIGLCIAMAYDSRGRARTLEVMRGLNGSAPLRVTVDRNINNISIASMGAPLKWPNGELATDSIGGNHTEGWDHPGWDGFPDGLKLKVTRQGDIITIETSDLFDPDNYVEDAKIVLDLNSTSTLRLFKGPCQWGYIAASQDMATWEVLQRPVDRDRVYNVVTGDLFTWNNHQWVTSTESDLSNILKPGRLYYNQVIGTLDYYDPDTLEIVNINTQ